MPLSNLPTGIYFDCHLLYQFPVRNQNESLNGYNKCIGNIIILRGKEVLRVKEVLRGNEILRGKEVLSGKEFLRGKEILRGKEVLRGKVLSGERGKERG